MKKQLKVWASARYVSGAALAVSLAGFAGAASAVPGYVTFGPNNAVVNAAGQCWKTGDWTPDKAVSPCDPVAQAAAPAAAVAVAAPAPVEPAPIAAAPLAPPPVIEKVAIATDVLFEFDSATLLPGGKKKLDEVADSAQGADVDRVVIVGHADRIGSEDYNQKLSEKRADAVRTYLSQKGADEQRIEAEGHGKAEPVTGNECDKLGAPRKSNSKLVACLQPDRRVEIEMLGSREVAGGSAAPSSAGASTTPSTSSSSSTSGSTSTGK
jgi:OOP family OmpA-OmpF porin